MADITNKVSKAQFDAFRIIQHSGGFNMFDPNARFSTGLDKETYSLIMNNDNYEILEAKYGKLEK